MGRVCAMCLIMLCQGCLDGADLPPLEEARELVLLTRNTPTTYYFDGDRASGFDYALARQFAQQHNMKLRIKVAFSLPELFTMLENGDGHLAVAGLSKSHKTRYPLRVLCALLTPASISGVQIRHIAPSRPR